jgi:hypothetical protein
MKNVHLIHVNRAKASLYHCSNTRDFFTTEQTSGDLLYELYITSDEEVKERDWFYNLTNKKVFYACKDMLTWLYDTKKEHKYWKKIILTTDQSLYGVQAIDDEFLEWFIKNPSCEEVEIQKWFEDGTILEYKIIIPQEEPTQETLEEVEKQVRLTTLRGSKVVKYLNIFKDQSIYNDIALAIEFGYQLKSEEDED